MKNIDSVDEVYDVPCTMAGIAALKAHDSFLCECAGIQR